MTITRRLRSKWAFDNVGSPRKLRTKPSLAVPEPGVSSISDGAPSNSAAILNFAIVASDAFERDCFLRCLSQQYPRLKFAGYRNLSEWIDPVVERNDDVLVYLCRGRLAVQSFLKEDIQAVRSRLEKLRVFLISDFLNPNFVLQSGRSPIDGYMGMHNSFEIIASAIMIVAAGGSLFSIGNGATSERKRGSSLLTGREVDIVYALSEGRKNRDIAVKLSMAESTVKVHVRNIMRKLKVNNRIQVIQKVRELYESGAQA